MPASASFLQHLSAGSRDRIPIFWQNRVVLGLTKISVGFWISDSPYHKFTRTAKYQYRKIEKNILRKGIARPQSQFLHSSICERFIYSQDRSSYSAAGICGPILGIYKSLTDTWMWKLGLIGHAIPWKGIHKWDFLCSAGLTCRLLIKMLQGGKLLASDEPDV